MKRAPTIGAILILIFVMAGLTTRTPEPTASDDDDSSQGDDDSSHSDDDSASAEEKD